MERTLITKRNITSNIKCDFQGIISIDDQEFEPVITNLTNLGYINFNIFKKNIKTDKINS